MRDMGPMLDKLKKLEREVFALSTVNGVQSQQLVDKDIEIASLITTIESQKEEIERLMGVNQHLEIDLSESKAITELKNEEIQGLKNVIEREQHYANTLDADLKKQTSITELAVNALKQNDEVLRELHSQIGQDSDINPSAKKVYLSKIQYVGETVGFHTLSEIEKLTDLQEGGK